MYLLSVEIMLVVTLFFVIFADLMLSEAKKHWLGVFCCAGLFLSFVGHLFLFRVSGELFGGMFVQDSFSHLGKALFLIIGFALVVMTRQYAPKLEHGVGEFYLLLISAVLGMCVAISSMNLLLIFIALEILTFASYIMTSYLKNDSSSIEAGIKYLIFGATASAFGLLGISLTFGGSGSFDLDSIRSVLETQETLQPLLVSGFCFILVWLAFKMAIVPFQLWAPDVYEGSPTPVTAFFSVGSKTAAFIIFLRIFYEVFTPIHQIASIVLAILSAATLIYANLAALPQTNIKRLFGYSSISHAGFLLMGMSVSNHLGVSYVLFYLISLMATNLCAFFVITTQSFYSDTDRIVEYEGLVEKSPFLAICLLISLLSLTGIPPTSGFIAKLLVLYSAFNEGFSWLAIIGIFAAVLSAFYYLSIAGKMFWGTSRNTSPITSPITVRVPLYALVIAILALGIFPGTVLNWCQVAATSLF